MNKAIVIFDYNNVFCRSYNLTKERRESILISIISRIVTSRPQVDYIEVRIYGGWYQDKELTRTGSEVMSEHMAMDLFPIVTDDKKIIRGEQIVVQSICDVDHIWYNTYREKSGIPRLIISRNARTTVCDENRAQCPIHILESFSRKTSRICNVEGCVSDNRSVFVHLGQKMVDAMMVCDILSFSNKPDTECIYILTDDVDLFPAIALSRSNNPTKEVLLGIVNRRNIELYKEYLKSFDVEVFQIYDVRGT